MKTYLAAFGLCTLTLGLLDAIWLVTMTRRFYAPLMGDLLAPTMKLAPAIAFYLLYSLGVAVLLVVPSIGAPFWQIFFKAAIFGAVAYGTYNLTCWSVIRNWNPMLSFVDISWGMVATTITTLVALSFLKFLKIGV